MRERLSSQPPSQQRRQQRAADALELRSLRLSNGWDTSVARATHPHHHFGGESAWGAARWPKLRWPWNAACLVGVFCGFLLALLGLYRALHDRLEELEGDNHVLKLPKTLEELKVIQHTLHQLVEANFALVLVAFCVVYVFKQTFSIPGSGALNASAGLLFGVELGWPLVCVLSATGATLCFFLSSLVGEQYVERCGPGSSSSRVGRTFFYMREKAASMRETPLTLLLFLTSMRLFPGTPNWLLNIVLPHCGVSVHHFFASILLGLMPYNFVTVSAGSVLASVESMSDLLDARLIMKLTVAAVLLAGLAPALRFVQSRFGLPAPDAGTAGGMLGSSGSGSGGGGGSSSSKAK